jgi:hypothetical protein
MLAFSSLAHAQATRTWVSGLGDDANPCSRTAPCKTFAGAISKTFINGEIDALDPGGFGTINITKSLTIDGGSTFASILASNTTGVTVNVGAGNANDPKRRVTLRHLTINGTGSSGTVGTNTGLKGINVVAANQVFVENCYIQNFSQEGINTSQLTESGDYLSVKDTNITDCNVGVNVSTTTGFIVGEMENVRIEKMASHGVQLGAGGNMKAVNCTVNFSGGDGFSIGAVSNASVVVERCFIGSNNVGIRNGSTGSTVDLSNTSLVQNVTALATSSGAAGGGINSHGNNQIIGTVGVTPNPVGQQ